MQRDTSLLCKTTFDCCLKWWRSFRGWYVFAQLLAQILCKCCHPYSTAQCPQLVQQAGPLECRNVSFTRFPQNKFLNNWTGPMHVTLTSNALQLRDVWHVDPNRMNQTSCIHLIGSLCSLCVPWDSCSHVLPMQPGRLASSPQDNTADCKQCSSPFPEAISA